MSLRAQLVRRIAELTEEDLRALLGVVERLRAEQAPARSSEVSSTDAGGSMLHPERFGALPGSVRLLGEMESSDADPDLRTFDVENVRS